MVTRPLLAKIQVGAALIIWALAFPGAVLGVARFADWLYCFAWWPLILCLDGLLVHAGEESWLWDRPREFFRLAGWSVTVWLVFEGFNLYLHNWGYRGIEPRLWVRWPGYALSFGTVLPGIFLTAQVLEAKGCFARVRGPSRACTSWQPPFLILGAACLVLPFVLPRYAFPLIWLTFIFLLDPVCELLSGDSLTGSWLSGERQRHLCLLSAGLLCGLWWELWNYPAAARWVYTLPALDFGKIFEMPLLGYLGFPAFALEVAVMYNLLLTVDERVLTAPRQKRWFWLSQGIFWAFMFWAIDAWTVISFG